MMAPKRKRPSVGSETSLKRNKSDADAEKPDVPAGTVGTSALNFSIEYTGGKIGNKGKLSGTEERSHSGDLSANPWQELKGSRRHDLDSSYVVLPKLEWSNMKPYSNCLIQTKTYRVGETVFVRTDKTKEMDQDDMKQYWIAKILSIRAKDPQNVYALVVWFYWPEELPKGGRKPYHGKNEVIASNWFDVVEVLSFAGHADISYWDESTDIITSQLYWRQTYAASTTATLSSLKEHCICHGHFNPDPDKAMYICDNEYCGVWLHKDCILEDAVVRHSSKVDDGKSSKKSASKLFKAVLEENAQAFEIEITDLREGEDNAKYTEDAKCLKCGTVLLR